MHVCAYCGGTKFREGPSGGMSVNVLCANEKCRHWFNDMGPFGFQDLHKVEPTVSEAALEKIRERDQRLQEIEDRVREGAKLYQGGEHISKCFRYQIDGFTAPAHADVNRLAGFLLEAIESKRL